MRWEDERLSDNVEDDRGQGFGGFGGGGGGPVMIGGGGLGAVVLIGLALLFGVDPRALLQGSGDGGYGPVAVQTEPQGPRADDEDARFSRAVLAYTEDTWDAYFREQGGTYQPPTLVLYDQGHQTGCGFGQTAMGPFYCPADRRVYLDLEFFHELSGRFGAPGRFAEAYVIAHEVGHHVQNLLGISERTDAARQSASRVEGNRISVRVELQADCFAGVWAARTNQREHFLDPGDIDQGLAAASAVGDDTLQKETQGRVVPDAFTHGSSAQRTKWFRRGYDSPKLESCDTFAPDYGQL
ncbi:MAG TPA: neutral zinc metallopeptidase [Caulobacteraceae bacterium]|jgi:predicted metalloprotease|nr:neutral zinc metallopeptidase [Caulobacteraceae bacterium]